MNKQITINSRKFDNAIHKSWKAELISESDDLLAFVGAFNSEIKHSKLGVIRRGTVSYEFYWKSKWFNIFRFHEPEGELRNFYCNINLPPVFRNRILDYVDLDIDVLIWNNFSFEILDLDEFEAHALKYNYSDDLRKSVDAALDELLLMISKRKFPFDYQY